MENNTNTATNTAKTVWDPAEKKLFGRSVDFINWGVLLYLGVVFFISTCCVVVYLIIAMVIAAANRELNSPDSYNTLVDSILKTDGGMIAGVICGSAVMILFMMKRVKPKEIFAKQKKMTIPAFLSLLFIFMSIQLPTMILFDLGEKLLNMLGLSAESAMEAATANSDSLLMMAYVGFFAPFFEEFIFRGFTMKAYNKLGCGKLLPIIVSAALFGIMHGNPVQILFAFAVGLVLGYTAMEYGIIWSILIHFLNNFIFGDIATIVFGKMPEPIGDIAEIVMFAEFFVAGIIALIINRKKIAAYIKENTCDKKYFLRAFCSIPLMIFTAICLLEALLLIQKA